MTSEAEDAVRRRTAVADYRKKLLQHKELDSRVRGGQIYCPLNPSFRFLFQSANKLSFFIIYSDLFECLANTYVLIRVKISIVAVFCVQSSV